jgi:SpoVK/Ycf46/Vps4 family AAA+-type ATPase
LSALIREASEFALKEFIKEPTPENELVKLKHFELAFKKIKPSVSQKVIGRGRGKFIWVFILLTLEFNL